MEKSLELYQYTASELSDMLLQKKCSTLELAESVLQHVKKNDHKIGAYITLLEETILKQAKLAERFVGIQPLAGIPIGLKDNICQERVLTTCGSQLLRTYIPMRSATVAQKLISAGAVIMGKLNLDEFAMGSSCETSFQKTKNPYHMGYVPGGSSGGCAAAVASGEAICAIGTDTGGSIRQPAAFCGIVGFKPTHGSVPTDGIFPLAPSLDVIGPMTRSVKDAALLFDVLKSSGKPIASTLDGNLSDIKIGIPSEYFSNDMDDIVKSHVLSAAHSLEEMGANLVKIHLPHTNEAYHAYFILSSVEAIRSLRNSEVYRSTGMQTEILNHAGKKAKYRFSFGSRLLSSNEFENTYSNAQAHCKKITSDFCNAYQDCDLILAPTTTHTAYEFHVESGKRQDTAYDDALTTPSSLAGLPAISLPCGFHSNGMPIGLQLIGKMHDERRILNVGSAIEKIYGIVRPV